MPRTSLRDGGRSLPIRIAAPSGGSPSPTTVTVSGSSTLTVGTPSTYTYTLDRPVVSGTVSIVPSVTGFASGTTFGTNPVVITAGNSSGTTAVDAGTAAAGTVTGTSTPTLTMVPESVTASAPGARVPLSASDFTLAGWYTYNEGLAGGMTFAGQLTHRYVGGEFRLLMSSQNAGQWDVIEVAPGRAGAADGRQLTSTVKTNTWNGTAVWKTFTDLGYPSNQMLIGTHSGIWWEDLGGGTGRLWGSMGIDYPTAFPATPSTDNQTQAVTVRTLNSNGTVSGYAGPWGFQGVSQRCVMGRVQKNPSWFQSAYSVGPYMYGFGGYASLVEQGGLCSYGLFAVAAPDVTTYPPSSFAYGTGRSADWNVPSSDFKILADHRSGVSNSDYSGSTPRAWDRGWKLAATKNFFDSPSNTPANGTLTNAQVVAFYDANAVASDATWKNPGPDGKSRMDWADSYFASGTWIDGPSKQGLVAVASTNEQWGGYVNSTTGGKTGGAEIHCFDPADLGAVAQGTKQPWNVQPNAMKSITSDLLGLGLLLSFRGNEQGGAVGATFDATTGKLWLSVISVDQPAGPFGGGGYQCALVVYDVNF